MSEKRNPIPIKNLFYMLCYAWNVLSIKDEILVGTDDYDDAYNILGRVFSFGIGKLIRSGFHRSYIQRKEERSILRGKVNVQESINRLSAQRKMLICKCRFAGLALTLKMYAMRAAKGTIYLRTLKKSSARRSVNTQYWR